MTATPPKPISVSDFVLVGIANAVPLAGYFLLDISFTAVALLYWLDAVTIIFVYAGLAMIATPERDVNARETISIAGPTGGRYFSEKPIRLSRRIPPIYLKNFRFIGPTTIFVLVIAIGAGGGVTVWGVGAGTVGGSTEGDVTDFAAQFSLFTDPAVFVIGSFIVATHLVTFYRYYGLAGRYRELTAYMTLDIQVTYVVAYGYLFTILVFWTIGTFLATGFVFPTIVSESFTWLLWEVLVACSFLLLKLLFERSRFYGERQPELDDDSFTASFSPTPPPGEVRVSSDE